MKLLYLWITIFFIILSDNLILAENVIESTDIQNSHLPNFLDYKCSTTKFKKAKNIDLNSYHNAKHFRTVLKNGFKQEVNYACHFIIVTNGCGMMCQEHWIIDSKSGKIKNRFQTMVGAEFKKDSNLLILNPIYPSMKDDIAAHKLDSTIPYPLWKDEKATYLIWEQNKFKLLKEIDIYRYLTTN